MKLYRLDDFGIEMTWREDYFDSFDVLKVTPCGFWIDYYGRQKWVNGRAKNAFAFDTKEKALFNYQKRKERQIEILKGNIYRAETNLSNSKIIDLSQKLLDNPVKIV